MKECKVSDCGSTDLASRSAMCKAHHREYVREHYKNNKQYYVDKAARWRDQHRVMVRKIKEESPCADCGVNYPYYVMDFDHRADKEFDIARVYGKVSTKALLAEIEKCDIVCSNCHRERTHTRRLASVYPLATNE